MHEVEYEKRFSHPVTGQPRPALTWWRDYSVIDETFEYNEKDVTTNQLVIGSLARHHLLSIFTCQAANNNMTVPAAASLTLDLNLKPTDVKISQHEGQQELVAEREAVLECSAFGSRPRAVLSWTFAGQRYSTPLSAGSLGEHQTSTTITISPRREHHGAEVTCTAENPKIPDSAISDVLRLDVQCECDCLISVIILIISRTQTSRTWRWCWARPRSRSRPFRRGTTCTSTATARPIPIPAGPSPGS